MRRVLFVVGVAVAVAGVGATSASAAPVGEFAYAAEAGATPLSGSARWVAPADEVGVWESGGAVKVDASSADGWDWARVELSAPAGEQLHEGTYVCARHRGQADPQLDSPGFFVARGTRSGALGCIDDQADFTISQLTRAGDGSIVDLEATFVERCGGPDAPAATGEVHFHG